ncbi:hypothetical protein MRX96_026061 [Rhipicephalus microplus]
MSPEQRRRKTEAPPSRRLLARGVGTALEPRHNDEVACIASDRSGNSSSMIAAAAEGLLPVSFCARFFRLRRTTNRRRKGGHPGGGPISGCHPRRKHHPGNRTRGGSVFGSLA